MPLHGAVTLREDPLASHALLTALELKPGKRVTSTYSFLAATKYNTIVMTLYATLINVRGT
jgi:hypothetical protein